MLAHIHTYRRPLQKSNKVAKFQHVTSEVRTIEHLIPSPVRYSFTTEAAFGSEAVAHWARDRMFYGSNLASDMLEFCDLI